MRGKVTEHTSSVPSCGDRPRLCGEKPRWIRFHLGYLGSPPPMRGKADRTRNKEGRNRITPAYAGKGSSVILDCVISGITPAYAGKRSAAYCFGVRVEDHPRLCGEKFKIAFVIFARSGSPPPMRGKETKKHIEFHVNRITPAYAGKSALHSSSGSGGLDHPRLCGEKLLGDCEPAADRGSPPPMRGKEDGMKIRVDLDGITPAYAGKSICLFCICIQI